MLTGASIVSNIIFAQDPIIFSNDPYSGISAAPLSPTQPFLNPNGWDVHIFSENIFFQSDYIYISKTSLLGLTKGSIESADISEGITGENSEKVSDYYNKDVTGYHLGSDFMGPSFSLNLNIFERDFSVGLFSRLRTQSSITEVDNYLKYTNQEIDEPYVYDLGPFETNFMNWAEIGLNLSTDISPNSEQQWIVGANLKYEMGLDAFYVDNKEHAVMRREDEPDPENEELERKSLYISNFDIDVAYATNYNFETDSYDFGMPGKGFGIDFGIAMVNLDRWNEGYDLKMSLNALDIGYVNFAGNVHNFKGSNLKYTNNPVFDETEFESPEQYAQLISNEVYGNPNESRKSNAFTVGLPTSIHFNISKNIGGNQLLNFNLIQRAPIFENSLKRANVANVSYYKTKEWIGYGASISTYEYQNIQFGGFIRLGPLLIGSENILPIFFSHKKLHALDFYIGLKLYPLRYDEIKKRSKEKCWCDD